MSGGTFEYADRQINDIIIGLQDIIRNNTEFSKKTIKEFNKGLEYLKLAELYAHRIDWLVAGDDGEETFHERLKEDIAKIKD